MGNVLVIDDEKPIALMITMALARYNFNVETAANAAEGLKKFDEGRFDLVITDMRLPGIDGNFVIKYIRNSDRSFTPVVGISGTSWLLKDADFDAVLAKPFRIQDLIETVHNLTATAFDSSGKHISLTKTE